MAKRFEFDDEIDYQENSNEDVIQETSMNESIEPQVEEVFENVEVEEMTKRKKRKFQWKWWHYVLIGLFVLCVAFAIYIFSATNNEGPVYGPRCEGLVTEISQDKMNATIKEMKGKYSEIQDMSMEVVCKQLKLDITYKDGMDTKKAQSIAEETVQKLDASIGLTKDKGKKYSHLFGFENNVAQFEVNLILISNDSKDFPIYGTKHTLNDSFGYTLASVKDKTSHDKAQETTKE